MYSHVLICKMLQQMYSHVLICKMLQQVYSHVLICETRRSYLLLCVTPKSRYQLRQNLVAANHLTVTVTCVSCILLLSV
jgi:hypothetical protein